MITWGDPRLPGRFWAKVTQNGGHLLWAGTSDQYREGGRGSRVVRPAVAVARAVGMDVPRGWHVVSACGIPGCLAHIEVLSLDQVRERRWQQETECPNGHPWTPENTAFWGGRTHERKCRACNRERVGRS